MTKGMNFVEELVILKPPDSGPGFWFRRDSLDATQTRPPKPLRFQLTGRVGDAHDTAVFVNRIDYYDKPQADVDIGGDVDIGKYLARPVEGILETIENTLAEDREEGRLHNEACASPASVVACKEIALHIHSWLARSTGLEWTAAGESTRGAVLVIRSPSSNRRVDFSVSGDGKRIVAATIDEEARVTRTPLSASDRDSLRKIVEWVRGRS